MENESGIPGESRFAKRMIIIQNGVEIVISIIWLAAAMLVMLIGNGKYRKIFEIVSIGLLGISLFDIITMISFSTSKQHRFSVTRFIVRLVLGALAVIGLAFSLFALEIKIH